MKKLTYAILAGVALFTVASCGNNNSSKTSTESTEAVSEQPTQPEAAAAVTLELSAGDDMKYDKDTLRAKPGQEVTVVLHHTGKQSKASMGHDFVLLKLGGDYKAFGEAATKAPDRDHLPADLMSQVIAHSEIIGGGETTQVTFAAPTVAGYYPYVCSFPGHYTMMHGVLVIE